MLSIFTILAMASEGFKHQRVKIFSGLIHLQGKALIIWTTTTTKELLGYLPSEGKQTVVILSQQLEW